MNFSWIKNMVSPFRSIGSKLGNLIGIGQKSANVLHHGGALHYPAGGRGLIREAIYGMGRVGGAIGSGLGAVGRGIGRTLGLVANTAPIVLKETVKVADKFNPNLKPFKNLNIFQPVYEGGKFVGERLRGYDDMTKAGAFINKFS